MFIIIPGAYNAQTGVAGASQQGQIVTIGSILKVTERDRRPFPTDAGIPSEIWIDNTAGIGYICKESDTGNGTVWDRLELLGDFVTFGDANPGAIQDITMGYRPGSLRYARNSEILWICKSNTQGAAVWDVLSSGGSVVSVNGQTGVVQLYLDDILDVNTLSPNNGDVLTWDSGTSTWIAAAPTGGGGTYTVDNGLTESPANNFQLGGTLIQNTQINALTFYLELIGNLSTPLLKVYNAGTGIAIDATNAGSNPVIKGVSAIGSGVLGMSTSNSGVVGISTSGSGLAGSSNSGVGATVSGVKGISSYGNNDVSGEFNITYTSNNDVKPGINIVRATSSGSALAGIGSSFDFWLPNDVLSTTFQSNIITSKWTDITTGALISQFEIYGRNTILSRLLAIKGTGQLVLDKYGTGTPFTGTVVKALGVNSSGDVIEFTAGGSSPLTTKGDLYTFDTADARLPVGLDTQVLLADSTTATGLKWGTNTTPPASGYYGAFSDITDQFATVINTGYPMLLGVTDLTNGVTVVSGSRVTIANTGIYNIQWSAQFRNPDAAEHDVTIWLRKNGVDVPGSAGIVSVPRKHGSLDGHVLPSWNFLIDPIVGDYYEFVWSTTDIDVFISFEPAGSPPPSTASVVLTVTQQAGILAGTGITAINSLTASTQTLASTDLNISSAVATHNFSIANNAVTYAKMQAVSATSILLGSSSTTTPVQEIILGTNLSMSGNTLNATGSGGGGITELTGDVTTPPASSGVTAATLKSNLKTGSFGVTIDGITSVIQIGQVGYVVMPYDGTITGWSITANVAGNVQFDVWRATSAIPILADTIIGVGGNYPQLSSPNQFITSTIMTSWTLGFLAGDVFGFYINSASTIKNATLTLRCTKT